MDEVDAALDEQNARRFGELLKDFVKKTQFIVVTHNRATMEAAEVLYGVTMSQDGTSKIVSLKLE
jgi:chromosome segregation protein